jgi:hypothetical protein
LINVLGADLKASHDLVVVRSNELAITDKLLTQRDAELLAMKDTLVSYVETDAALKQI